MNLRFQPLLDNINQTEVYLQELELRILKSKGSAKFKWNNITDLKRQFIIIDATQQISGLIDHANEVRDTIRHFKREYLKLQLALRNLNEFSQEIEIKANKLELKLIKENFLNYKSSSQTKTEEILAAKTVISTEEEMNIEELPSWDWEKTEFLLPTVKPNIASVSEFHYSIV